MKALYRKYRPTRLDEVVGQEQVTKVLSNSLKAGKINHAYLFVGPRGCGKTSVARILAHEVNGFKYEIEDDYVDIIEIDGASNRGIDNIRELREKVMIAPTMGKYKIYIIDEVHMLTKEAFNALLKTLEEPPEHAIFIMATTDAHKVPVTITSRSQAFTFKLADHQVMFDFLKRVVNTEKIQIDDDALSIIVKRGEGSFRDSLSLLDQISTLSEGRITKEMVISAMGLPQDEKIAELLSEYSADNVVRITTLLKELLSSGVKPETLAEEMISAIIDDPNPNLMGLLAKLPEVKAPYATAKLLVALVKSESSAPSPSYDSSHAMIPTNANTTQSSRGKMHPPETTATNSKQKSNPDNGVKNISGTNPTPSEQITAESRINPTPSKQASTEPGINHASSGQITTESNVSANFDWDDYLEKIQNLNDAVHAQLLKVDHEYEAGILHIYPKSSVLHRILKSKNNHAMLTRSAPSGTIVKIHDAKEKPKSVTKDSMISKLSDIMGGEVRNDTGGNPF